MYNPKSDIDNTARQVAQDLFDKGWAYEEIEEILRQSLIEVAKMEAADPVIE